MDQIDDEYMREHYPSVYKARTQKERDYERKYVEGGVPEAFFCGRHGLTKNAKSCAGCDAENAAPTTADAADRFVRALSRP